MRRSLTLLPLLILALALPAWADQGADRAADRVADDGARQLIEMAKAGDAVGVRTLLDAGIDVEATDWAGWTPLTWAALLLRREVIGVLLDAGADLEVVAEGGKNSGTPLMMAAKKWDGLETVKLLLSRGADVDGADQYGRNALMMAARYGRLEIVELLLAQGADPRRESRLNDWRSALSLARSRGHEAVAERLAQAGARR